MIYYFIEILLRRQKSGRLSSYPVQIMDIRVYYEKLYYAKVKL